MGKPLTFKERVVLRQRARNGDAAARARLLADTQERQRLQLQRGRMQGRQETK